MRTKNKEHTTNNKGVGGGREIRGQVEQALREAVRGLTGLQVEPRLEHPGKEEHGDYSSNIAMAIFAEVTSNKRQVTSKNPLELAEEIREKVGKVEGVEKVEVVKPGFINFWLSEEALLGELETVLKEGGEYGKGKPSGQKFVVEHTSPNTNKPLHVGHVRNNVLAMAVIRTLQFCGREAIPVEIINDRGAHICKSMAGYLYAGQRLKASPCKDWREKLVEWSDHKDWWIAPEDAGEKGDHFVGKYYVEAVKKEKEDEEFAREVVEMLVAWEDGDKNVRDLWQTMNAWFYLGVEKTYDRLGSLESQRWYESAIYQDGKWIIEKNIGGIFIKQQDGSIIANLSKYNLPNPVVLRADGTAVYMTQDIALIKDRKEKLGADKLVYVVANEQSLHFQQLFAIAEMLGYGKRGDFYHLAYGLVRLTSGSMSSRLGTVVGADELMDQAVKKARVVIDSANISKDVADKNKLAEEVGLGAVKYSMLRYNPAQDMIFDWDKSISFEGDSGPYLQYTYARTRSVLKKAKATSDKRQVTRTENLPGASSEELSLLRALYKFPEVVQQAAGSYSPNLLCNYLFDLAQKFNVFYAKHRIIEEIRDKRQGRRDKGHGGGDSEESDLIAYRLSLSSTFRLALTQVTGIILKTGLELLGIASPEKM